MHSILETHSPPDATARGRSPLLELEELSVTFATPRGPVDAVRELTLSIREGECVGIVGESGAGKSQALLAVMGLLGRNARVGGRARFEGSDLLGADERVLNGVRGSRLAMIFQDPMTSLTPHLRIGRQIAESLAQHRGMSGRAARDRALELLQRVHIADAARRLDQYPHQLSGGMRQRAMIAIALACDPALLIADEPTTALDVTVQAQILALLAELKRERGMSMVLITHDFGVVAGLADRVAVMYGGRLVELGPTRAVLQSPAHPYTQALLRSMPRIDDAREGPFSAVRGQPPNPRALPPGCAFHPRCEHTADRCRRERPLLAPHGASLAACHFPLALGRQTL